MHSINVLILGNSNLIPYIKSSKFLKNLFIINNSENNDDLTFVTFKELAMKCRALKIDLVIVEDEKYIMQGIVDVLKNNLINCIAPNSKWTDLILSKISAKKFVNRYNILTPLTLTYPQNFPLIVKYDNGEKIANSIQEIVETKKQVFEQSPEIAKTIFLEEKIEGTQFDLLSLFDGKNLLIFPPQNTKIENSIILEYKEKLQTMLVSEQFNFIGFINSKLVLSNNKIYNIGFSLTIPKPDIKMDLLYIFILAVYQKLNEINLFTQ